MPETREPVPIEMSEEEKARRLTEMETNRAMMQAAADTPGVPGQRHVVESHKPPEMTEEEARVANPDLIISADVPKAEDE